MNTDPKLQSKLYGFDFYITSLINLYKKNKLSNKILLSGPKGIGKSTLAYHFINYVFSLGEDYSYNFNDFSINSKNRSFKLIENQSHPNFYNIYVRFEKKNIEISQIREMINYANKSSFNNKPRFVLIDNTENLNMNSLNALLKIVEEPNDNLFFILIHDNNKKLKNTLKSRCVTFKLNLTFDRTIEITSKILNQNINDILSDELINYYSTPGELINLVNFAKNNNIDLKNSTLKKILLLLINENYYNKNNFIKHYIFTMMQVYFLKLLHHSNSKHIVNPLYTKFINMINDCTKFNLNYENLFIEFKKKILNE